MANIQTEAGKKWLKDFQGSEQRMRAQIIAIETELRQMIQTEKSQGNREIQYEKEKAY